MVIRFINDILLSAPSIVIGLFVYEIMVVTMGHFSAWAGGVALAMLVIPVVVRTTENMLLLVPNTLREAATALGSPRWMVIGSVAYRAARAGILTGLLLAVARITGETAPLLFTALNNQFWSLNPNAPMANLPVTIFQFALSPYAEWQQLAWTGALIITVRRARPQRRSALPLNPGTDKMSEVASAVGGVQSQTAARRPIGATRQGVGQEPALLLRRHAGAEGHQCRPRRPQGDRVHRAVRLRQVDAASRPQPHLRPLPEPAGGGRGDARRRQHPVAAPGSESAARQGRHGLPEADAVSDVDLRQRRLRHSSLRDGCRAPSSPTASRRRSTKAALWGEVKDKLKASGLSLSGGQQQRLCIARTIAARPEVVLLDEPCSALDPISTSKIEELIDELKNEYTIAIVTHNMQQAARVSDFTAFMYLGDLVEFDETGKIFTDPRRPAHAGLHHGPLRLGKPARSWQ